MRLTTSSNCLCAGIAVERVKTREAAWMELRTMGGVDLPALEMNTSGRPRPPRLGGLGGLPIRLGDLPALKEDNWTGPNLIGWVSPYQITYPKTQAFPRSSSFGGGSDHFVEARGRHSPPWLRASQLEGLEISSKVRAEIVGMPDGRDVGSEATQQMFAP